LPSILIKQALKNGEACDVLLENGKIAAIAPKLTMQADSVICAEGLTLMPGLFDMHVHFRDPGLTHKEDIHTGAAAALAGGVTGVACMPNTKPPIDSPETVRYITEQAADTGVAVHSVGCITKGMQGEALCDYDALRSSGVRAISDDGRPVEDPALLRESLRQSKENGMLIISHCEDLNIINGGIMHLGEISAQLGVKGMDRASEDTITQREIDLARETGARIHIAHVSTKDSVEAIRKAKQRGVKVTCETCPHYFILTHEKLLSRDADFRMNPPLREEADKQAVLEGLLDGTIDCIVTDHAPHAAEEKADFLTAPNGVVGLETSLAATLTALYHTGLASIPQIIGWMAEKPRDILGLAVPQIRVGASADLILVDLNEEWTVDPDKLHSKSKNTVFKGMRLRGKVKYTITDGQIRFADSTSF